MKYPPALIERTYYIRQYTKRVAANKHNHSILFRVKQQFQARLVSKIMRQSNEIKNDSYSLK